MATPLAVAVERLANKEESVKEQLAKLERVEEKLDSVESAVDVELESSLHAVEAHFNLLKEVLEEKQIKYKEKLHEVAAVGKNMIQEWKTKLHGAAIKAKDALVTARDLSADEEGFFQRYSGASQCLEENFLSLLLLMHTIPDSVFSYPMQIRDMKLNMPSDLSQSILKLDVPCSMFREGVSENLEEDFSPITNASEQFLSVNKDNLMSQSMGFCKPSTNQIVEVHGISSEEESSTTQVEYGNESKLCENQTEESSSEREREELSKVPADEDEVNAGAKTPMTMAETLIGVAEPEVIVRKEDTELRKIASLTVRMENGEAKLASKVPNTAAKSIVKEMMTKAGHMETAHLTGSVPNDCGATAECKTSGAVTEPIKEGRSGKDIVEQESAICEQLSSEIKFGEFGKRETTEGVMEDSRGASFTAAHESSGFSKTAVFESCGENKGVSHSGSVEKCLLKPGEPCYERNQTHAVPKTSKDSQVYSAKHSKGEGHCGIQHFTPGIVSTCSTTDAPSVSFSASHSLRAECTTSGEECKETCDPFGPEHPTLLFSHSGNHHSMLQKACYLVDATSVEIRDTHMAKEDETGDKKLCLCDEDKTIEITAQLNVDQCPSDTVVFTGRAFSITETSSNSLPSNNIMKLIGYGETQKFQVTHPSQGSTCGKQEFASSSYKERKFCLDLPLDNIMCQSYSTEMAEESSRSELDTSKMVANDIADVVEAEPDPHEVHFVKVSVVCPDHCITMEDTVQHNGEIVAISNVTVTLDSNEMESARSHMLPVTRTNQECGEVYFKTSPPIQCQIDLQDSMEPMQPTFGGSIQKQFELFPPLHFRGSTGPGVSICEDTCNIPIQFEVLHPLLCGEVTSGNHEEVHVRVSSALSVPAVLGKVSDLVEKPLEATRKPEENAMSHGTEEDVSDQGPAFDHLFASNDPSLYREEALCTFSTNSQFILATDHVHCEIHSHIPIPNHNCGVMDISASPNASSIQPTITEVSPFRQCVWRSSLTPRETLEEECLLQLGPRESTVSFGPQDKYATETNIFAKEAAEPCAPPRNAVEAVDEDSTTGPTEFDIPFMETHCGCELTVLVIETCGSCSFIAQPYAPYLIELMEAMREYYDDPTHENKLSHPKVGRYCCARFSEDNCWYRAKIMSITESHEDENLSEFQVLVKYVDYGNHEYLPSTNLRTLCKGFCELACQALTCTVVKIESVTLSSTKPLSSELLGKTLQIRVTTCLAPNVIEVELLSLWSSVVPMSPSNDVGVQLSTDNGALLPLHQDVNLHPPAINLHDDLSFPVVISHVNDVTHFYVHLLDRVTAQQMMHLETIMQAHYSVAPNRYPVLLGRERICCVYSATNQMYCRAVVMKQSFDSGDVRCQVQLVDYGDMQSVLLKDMLALSEEFIEYPTFCICCQLFDDEREQLPDGFLEHATRKFKYLITEDMKRFTAFPSNRNAYSGPFSLRHWDSILSIELHDSADDYDVNVNEELAKALAEETRCKDQIDCDRSRSTGMSNWDPMQCDFLLTKNTYSADYEHVGSVLFRHDTKSRICRYFGSSQGCFAGDSCRYSHLYQDVWDSEIVKTHGQSIGSLDLPDVGDFVILLITAIATPQRFYAQMPFGKNALTDQTFHGMKAGTYCPASDLDTLLKAMSDFYNRQVFDEDNALISAGEIVATHDEKDMHWYRAKVLQCDRNQIVVFYVDYGNMCSVSASDIRVIKQEFMVLPFQAMECYLTSDKFRNNAENETRNLLNHVTDTLVVAEVVQRRCESLGIHIYNDQMGDDYHNQLRSEKHFLPTYRPG